MLYNKRISLRDGRTCILRNGDAQDGQALFDNFMLTHAQILKEKAMSPNEIEIIAEIDGRVVGSAGIERVGHKDKVKHRAEFGISVDKDCWGLGVGRALTRACIECAKTAGYLQLELQAVEANERAVALYRSEGFVEYGRNPRGFRSRINGWQPILLMRLELDGQAESGLSQKPRSAG